MRLTQLARRLEIAADELTRMRSELAGEEPLRSPGRGPAHELIAMVNATWSHRQTALASLTTEVTSLADNLRLAADRYASTDHTAADTLTNTLAADPTASPAATTDSAPTDSASLDRSHPWTR